MASGTIAKRLSRRQGNSLDAEREEFLKQMTVAMGKAINKEECAVKEKHLRITILGTHKEQGANYFWDNVMRLQVEGHHLVAWKFCHVFHKVMREGHPNVLKDSAKFKTKLYELGRYWGHLKEGYGRLILHYCKLDLTKLEFHIRNPEIPGNLVLGDQAILALGDGDVNNCFQIAIEALDYQDEILTLQRKVFDSMDMSRANSLTNMGQCRLAPLILCIQDASCLYDYLVKILFRLHASCPKDTLGGHRERFNTQFRALKQFFYTSSNLQYFKHLVSIPPLPDSPPNFMVASDFDSYVPHRVIVHGADDDRDSIVSEGTLVDFSAGFSSPRPPSPPPTPANGGQAALEKDAIIVSLRHDLDDTKAMLQRLRNEYSGSLEQAQNRALQLEHELAQARDQTEALADENQRYRSQAEALQNESNTQTAAQLEETQRKAASSEEKFNKMKDVYAKLRQEHIDVLGRLGSLQKVSEAAKKDAADAADQLRASERRVAALSLQHEQLAQQDSAAAESQRGLEAELTAARSRLSEAESSALAKEMESGAWLAEVEGRVDGLQSELEDAKGEAARWKDGSLGACVRIIETAREECEEPAHLSVASSPEFVLTLSHATATTLAQDDLSPATMAHEMAHLVCFLKATANVAPSGKGEGLEEAVEKLCSNSLSYLAALKSGSSGSEERLRLVSGVQEAEELIRALQGRLGDVSKDELGGLMEEEMAAMDSAIQAAAAKMQEIMAKSRAESSGVRLEVNGKILDACTSLMQAVLVLVARSRELQREIVAAGRGAGGSREFYKRHHQWTEGLLSAAKAVGQAAGVLVNSADRVVGEEGKLEELMVASQEIAAATAQLVVASRVKAERESERLAALTTASRGVSSATAAVLGSVKSGRQTLEEEEDLDFSKYSVHQSKKLEMESQVRVLELESSLEKERRRLGQLRKNNYRSDDDSSKEATPAPN